MMHVVVHLLLCLFLMVVPGTLAAQTANDPPPPVNLEDSNGLGRQRIATALEAGGRAHALVIGVEQFTAPWQRLSGVRGELDAVVRALGIHGFAVRRVQGVRAADGAYSGEVSAAEIRKELSDFVRQYGQDPENRLIIYVASHGQAIREEAAAGAERTGYIVASDTPAAQAQDFAARAVPVQAIAREVAEIRARHLILAFNTCFSGALVPAVRSRSSEGASEAPPSAPPLAPEVADWVETLLSRPAHRVMTAGDGSQTVPDEDAAFGRAFVEGLYGAADLDGDGLILAAELGQHVRARVARETYKAGRPNDPLFVSLPTSAAHGAEGGDFVFLSPRGPAGAEVRRDHGALEKRRSILPGGTFADCLDCPTMTDLSEMRGPGIERRMALGRTEVTAAQWSACFRQGFCRRWKPDAAGGDAPATHMTWSDALDYLDFLNAQEKPQGKCQIYRLPRREEWLAAARAGVDSRYGWGDKLIAGRANCIGCGSPWDGRSAAPAASFPANAFGLHDMVGNLWEWVAGDTPCSAVELAAGRCMPGRVMGGAYSTHIDAIDLSTSAARTGTLAEGMLARSGNRNGLREPGWPTVGLRVACDLDGSPVR